MSILLINRSDDLSALVNRGYHVAIRGGYLLVEGIPYIREDGTIGKATIVTGLDIADGRTGPPSNHTVWWTGKMPYTADGHSMKDYLVCSSWHQGHDLGEGILVYMQWSRKPKKKGGRRGYNDYYEKIETYVDEVAGQAETKRPGVLDVARSGADPEVASRTRFKYLNTGTYQNGIRGIEKRFEDEVIAVVGVGREWLLYRGRLDEDRYQRTTHVRRRYAEAKQRVQNSGSSTNRGSTGQYSEGEMAPGTVRASAGRRRTRPRASDR